MKRTKHNITPPFNSIPNTSNFFIKQSDAANNLKALYLFCTEEKDDTNQLFFFISGSYSYCEIKKNLNSWEKINIDKLFFEKNAGSKTYFFKKNDYNIDTLTIPFPFENNAYCTFQDRRISLKTITLSQEELMHRNIHLASVDLTSIPKTIEEAKQQLELAEKKQEINKEIQKIEIIINLLSSAIETVNKLNNPAIVSINLTEQVKQLKETQQMLREKQHLLEYSEGPIQTIAAMKI